MTVLVGPSKKAQNFRDHPLFAQWPRRKAVACKIIFVRAAANDVQFSSIRRPQQKPVFHDFYSSSHKLSGFDELLDVTEESAGQALARCCASSALRLAFFAASRASASRALVNRTLRSPQEPSCWPRTAGGAKSSPHATSKMAAPCPR
jgi:hypothetical protein